jgi:hypothetical protein
MVDGKTVSSAETWPMAPVKQKVTVQWLVPERVILIEAKGDLELRDRETAHSQIINLIHSCSTPNVHLISDTKQMTHIPWSVFNRPSGLAGHPRRGWWMNIGTVPTVRIKWLSRLLASLSRRRYIHCETMHEALRTLQRLDPTLPDLIIMSRAHLQAEAG